MPEISWISGDVWSKDRLDFSQSKFQDSVVNVALKMKMCKGLHYWKIFFSLFTMQ